MTGQKVRGAALVLVAGVTAIVSACRPHVRPAEVAAPAPVDAAAIPDDYVEQALVAAKDNRGELTQAIEHFRAVGDAQRLGAIRFLVANMPGKGHQIFALKDKRGNSIPFDPLAYPDFNAAEAALDAIATTHGKVEFKADRTVLDVETVKADFLIRHVENAFRAWHTPPPQYRASYDVFLNYILPYRGSEEPLVDWLTPALVRYRDLPPELAADPAPKRVLSWLTADAERRVRFDERWYLHPTDQSFWEMERTHGGRCEDITNMTTYAARARGIAVAQDYTPRWGHRDNNHAWPVLLDAAGRGSAPEFAHAAKVYRSTFAIQRNGLAALLPNGHEAPNRWIGGRSAVDVTDQYAVTSAVAVPVSPAIAKGETVAYACVFSGGGWFAIDWARVEDGQALFRRLGRGGRLGGIVWLPATYDGKELRPVAPPFILQTDGRVQRLPGTGVRTALVATAVKPEQLKEDSGAVAPASHLKPGATYLLQRWNGRWKPVKTFVATKEPPRFTDLPADGLYWLVEKRSRKLERIFTIENGRQRFW
jgi:hypothetical protein